MERNEMTRAPLVIDIDCASQKDQAVARLYPDGLIQINYTYTDHKGIHRRENFSFFMTPDMVELFENILQQVR